MPRGAAFFLRRAEVYLSVNWLEATGASHRQAQVQAVLGHLIAKLGKLPAKGRLAVLHLETAFNHVAENTYPSRILSAHHEPEPLDPSHAGIYGYEFEEDAIADLLAFAVSDTYSTRE
jgi:hypothetical protein